MKKMTSLVFLITGIFCSTYAQDLTASLPILGRLVSGIVATLVSYDLYNRYRSQTSDKQLVKAGRISGVAKGAGVFVINKIFPDSAIGQIPFIMMAFYLFIARIIMQVSLSYYFLMDHTAESNTLYWKSTENPKRYQ